MNYQAYLIVICDRETNSVLSATIWSSPEWEQSRRIDQPTYVAYAVRGSSFAKAGNTLLKNLENPKCRYHWLLKHLDDHTKRMFQC